jgi:spore germination protein
MSLIFPIPRASKFTALFKGWLDFLIAMMLAVTLLSTARASDSDKALAYFAWWLPQSWQAASLGKLDRLLFFELKVGPHGLITERNGWPEKWGDLRATLDKNGTPLDLTLTVLNERDFLSLFSSPVATRQLLDQAKHLAGEQGVSGLHLDFEVFGIMPAPVRSRFRQFVFDLAKALHAQKPARSLSVFLPIGAESQIYDARSLARIDYVVAQGYDAHWSLSPSAGPVAPLDGNSSVTWKKAINESLGLGIKRERLFLSYPLYGYEWPMQDRNPQGPTRGAGETTTLAPIDPRLLPAIQTNVQSRVKQFGSQNDPVSGSSYYQFQKNGQWTTGWFEGPWALDRKINFLSDQKLAGMAFFLMGYDEGKLLDSFLQRRLARGHKPCVLNCSVRSVPL